MGVSFVCNGYHNKTMGAFMGNSLLIRSAMAKDAGVLAAIHAPYVHETAVSFEIVPPEAGAILDVHEGTE